MLTLRLSSSDGGGYNWATAGGGALVGGKIQAVIWIAALHR